MRNSALLLLISFSICLSVDAQEKAKQARPYICNEANVIWNQSLPCDKDTPERQAIAHKLPKKVENVSLKSESANSSSLKPAEELSTIELVRDFPLKYKGTTIRIENIWLRGQIERDSQGLPASRRFIGILEDDAENILPIAIHNDWAFKLKRTLDQNYAYHIDTVRLTLEHANVGLYRCIKGIVFSGRDPKPSEQPMNFETLSPIIPDENQTNTEMESFQDDGTSVSSDDDLRQALQSAQVARANSLAMYQSLMQNEMVRKLMPKLPDNLDFPSQEEMGATGRRPERKRGVSVMNDSRPRNLD